VIPYNVCTLYVRDVYDARVYDTYGRAYPYVNEAHCTGWAQCRCSPSYPYSVVHPEYNNGRLTEKRRGPPGVGELVAVGNRHTLGEYDVFGTRITNACTKYA